MITPQEYMRLSDEDKRMVIAQMTDDELERFGHELWEYEQLIDLEHADFSKHRKKAKK